MIQIKILKDINGMLRNHIYNVSEEDAKKLVEHGCNPKFERNDSGKFVQVGIYGGTGDLAIYYSKDRDELNETLAPPMNIIPPQLQNCRLLQVSDEKSPFGAVWQKTNNTIKNTDFIRYVYDHEKYGVLCGWDSLNEKFLVVIDFDDEITQREVLENGVLPETFTCKTARKGLYHLYFYTTDVVKKWKILTKDKDTLADIQGEATQVIGPGSRIPDGRCYEIVKDIPIATIPVSTLHRALDQFNYQKVEEVLQETADGLTLSDFEKSYGDDKALAEVRRQLKIADILRDASISTSRNPTKCPFHSSKGGKCLGFDNNKGIWNCFHCLEHGTAIDLWMKINHVDNFIDAKKQLCEKFGIKDTFVVDKKQAAAIIGNGRPMQKLPCKNYTIEQFSADIAQYFKGDEKVFFKPDEDNIVEIKKFEDKLLKREIIGFRVVDTKRLLNIIEKKVNTYIIEYVKKEEVEVRQSPSKLHIELLSANEDFVGALYPIKRFLSYPIPFIDSTGELIIPRHQPGKGYYDDRFQAYFTSECPELKLMSVSEAKFLLNDMLSEFCFRDEQDRIMALGYIITPMCRGLYRKPTSRTPIFIIQANRERAGKDFLAGIRGILYEGQAIDDTPIVTGEKSESNNEELRKKLTSALKIGRRLFHSSNNRGFLNNATLEQFSTSEVWRDRELGRNTQLELSNEVDISLSANVGLTYTPDLHHRSRPINLFYSEENPNERAFKRTDLHGYVLSNRALLLSAIYTLINVWVTAGKPSSKTLFTSFPEWARVVGGIMQLNEMGDPCINIDDVNIGGDKETQSMKEFCGFMGLYQLNDVEQPQGYTISKLRSIVTEAQSREDIEGFSHWDLSARPDQVKFGNLIRRFVGREFHCKQQVKFKDKEGFDDWTKFKVILSIAKDNDRSNKILYGFSTEIEKDKVAPKMEQAELSRAIKEETIEELKPKLSYDSAKSIVLSMCASNIDVYEGLLIDRGITEEQIIDFINDGIIYRVKPGYVRLL
jgi:hypothetical protein